MFCWQTLGSVIHVSNTVSPRIATALPDGNGAPSGDKVSCHTTKTTRDWCNMSSDPSSQFNWMCGQDQTIESHASNPQDSSPSTKSVSEVANPWIVIFLNLIWIWGIVRPGQHFCHVPFAVLNIGILALPLRLAFSWKASTLSRELGQTCCKTVAFCLYLDKYQILFSYLFFRSTSSSILWSQLHWYVWWANEEIESEIQF